jgi:[ribosomal protein S18]-alanine N-acetyltransferase
MSSQSGANFRAAHLNTTIRFATRNDASTLAKLSRDTIEVGLSEWRWTPARVARLISREDMNVIVAEHAGAFVGFGAMAYAENGAHLYLLAVVPHWRHLGVGSDLLHWLELVARNMDASAIRLQALASNLNARLFYERRGFQQRFADADMYEGLGGVHLEKRLNVSVS